MKRITASEVRKNWFRVLDEVADGEVVVVERNGRRVVLRREDREQTAEAATTPTYTNILRVVKGDQADRWGWEWMGPHEDLVPILRKKR